jgi:hypothetical protein
MMSTYYVSIGNSDDKLAQAEWHTFIEDIDLCFKMAAAKIHGRWFSAPDAAFQNACWCFEAAEKWIEQGFKPVLSLLAHRYQQDSIALARAETEFVEPYEGCFWQDSREEAEALAAYLNRLSAAEQQAQTLLAEKELELGHAHEDWLHVNQDEWEALQAQAQTLRAKAELAAQFQDYLHMQETRPDFHLSVWEKAWLRKADSLNPQSVGASDES